MSETTIPLGDELVPIRQHEGRTTVSGRELHAFLQVKAHYKDWFPRMVAYGFVEGSDFCSILSESTGGRPSTDHALTLDMAKELSMIQRTPRGKQARQYFIEVEKRARNVHALPGSFAEALELAAAQARELESANARIAADAPKVLFADSVAASDSTILVGDLAKILKGNGVDVGANRLFEWLRRDGFLIKRDGSDRNMPTQRSMELGLFRIKETAVTHADGHVTVSKTPKVTGKGQTFLVRHYLASGGV